MLENQSNVLRFLQGYGDMLVADIEAEDFCKQHGEAMNHPAWILGHLAFANDKRGAMIGGEHRLAGWTELFGKGSAPSSDASLYPDKEELIATWHDANERLIAAAASVDPAVLQQAPAEESMAKNFPAVGDFITFLMTAHTGLHLGQLSLWRRLEGRPIMF